MPHIHTVTLNPALDQILYLPEFHPEVTNRLTRSVCGLGGKGTHVSINLALLGIDNTALGIAHGDTGTKIMEMLKSQGIRVCFQHYTEQDSRTNYLLIEDGGACTCLSSKGVPLTDKDISSFIQYLDQQIQEGDFLILSEDASNCPDAFVYNKIIQHMQKKHLKVFLDASGETLKKCIQEQPYLIKPNQDELSYLCGKELNCENDIREALISLDCYHIPVIAVSLGSSGSMVRINNKIYRVFPPKIQVKNTIGCGDCFLSGLIYGVYKGLSDEETLKLATAISAATAESELSVGFDMERAKVLKELVSIQA